MVPAQEILGLCWAIPELLRATQRSDAFPVYVQGKVRTLSPYEWWLDPLLIQKRVRTFREVVSAVSCHPALAEWGVLDGALDRRSPEPCAAEFVLRSLLAEIKEEGGSEKTRLSLGWPQLLNPSPAKPLIRLVDGVLLRGLRKPVSLDLRDLVAAAYLGVMARWVFDHNVEVEIGWDLMDGGFDPENLVQDGERFAEQGLEGVNWVSLCDPDPGLKTAPPWNLNPSLAGVGLLDCGLEPKPWVEEWIRQIRGTKPKQEREDFIDLSLEEYLGNPSMHLNRLWNHFKA